MKYRNTKTGAVIDIESEISGGNWQALVPAEPAEEKVAPAQQKRRTGKKKNE